ncbi:MULTISPECIES: DUF1002 domain-containing protein [unclassified Blautia]|uniref:DUF1002 domain-containing protein n=1 Tax=Candidatus Blautia stercorigallinarum TaxID=2838501 RepID=A0A9D1TDW8_9FIRM|nr:MULTISPECIES: DUF1002 domain-containing protein [unclassified Blautia]OUN30479.1 hypothetical protein B5G33_08360 [Blautia sp. An81]OUN90076.1 hypothetical protein B5G00_17170 [Blautia sp. An46]HIV37528.1 DUF1002 domain-containing protein [Candidatus Blautia stercorigallinarum]
MKKRWMAILLTCIMAVALPVTAYGASDNKNTDTPYVALGADLNQEERATVLRLLGISEEDLNNYTVTTVTNADEHEYLDSYLSSSIIGSRALSSVMVEGTAEGSGINVTTSNITYCTPGMYENALATAGIENADIKVAGPFNISGTAALVGAIKAYENMTGEEVKKENADTATNELVVTGQVAENVGDQEKAEQLIGAVKGEVVEGNATTTEEIGNVVDQAAQEMEVNLSEEDRQAIIDLMKKIDDLNLNIDSLKEQASNLYDQIAGLDLNLNIDEEQVKGFFEKILDFFRGLFS